MKRPAKLTAYKSKTTVPIKDFKIPLSNEDAGAVKLRDILIEGPVEEKYYLKETKNEVEAIIHDRLLEHLFL